MKQKVFILGAVGIAIIGIFLLKTHAQKENTGLTIHPSSFDITASGSLPIQNQTIYVDNHTNTAVPIQVLLRNFTAKGEEGAVDLTTNDTSYALAKWIAVTPTTATIPAHGTQKFTFTITPPASAEPGGHFGSIVFATVPPKNGTQGSGATLSQEIGSLLLVTIPGPVVQKAHVVSFTTDNMFYEFGPVNFTMRVQNEGGVHIQPIGAIQVTDMLGRTTDAPLPTYNVLPGSIRRIPVVFAHKFLFGRYTAKIIASYGSSNQPLEGYLVFYAFPVRYAVAVLLILIVLFLMRKRLTKAFKTLATGK